VSSLCIGNGLGRGKEWVKESQLVLTSHSTHIAPEGGAAFISSAQSTNTHTIVHVCSYTYAHTYVNTHIHTLTHTKTQTNMHPGREG